jgi:hypothetical protein
MPKNTEFRMTSGQALLAIGVVLVLIVGAFSGWFAPKSTTPTTPTTTTPGGVSVPLSVVPAIEKTKVYLSTFSQGDFDRDAQKNRVAGYATLIKSGTSIETDNTSASTAVASTAEFNGGDVVTVLAGGSGYYTNAVEAVPVTETLQPFEVMIKAANAPTISLLDDRLDEYDGNLTLDTNDVSKVQTIRVERPGDKNWYQLCGIAAEFDDNILDVRFKVGDSFVKGTTDLTEKYDNLKTAGADMVWVFDTPIKNFDSKDIPFVVGTAKDEDPSAEPLTITVFDCEKNLQSGKIVYTSETAADADVGLANTDVAMLIN